MKNFWGKKDCIYITFRKRTHWRQLIILGVYITIVGFYSRVHSIRAFPLLYFNICFFNILNLATSKIVWIRAIPKSKVTEKIDSSPKQMCLSNSGFQETFSKFFHTTLDHRMTIHWWIAIYKDKTFFFRIWRTVVGGISLNWLIRVIICCGLVLTWAKISI